mmetsp:Transcript_15902/g.24515  ORF Transcript_15902/g.24515 Transcript_15902/m.24515 type:complete len:113 (+) Transcript_15902:2739-3077(+)
MHNAANVIDVVLLKSGINEFKNNKGFSDLEEWREYSDGRVVKKKFNDNGYGRRIIGESGQKLHAEKLKKLKRVHGASGSIEEILVDEDGQKLRSLKDYLDRPDQVLEYEYDN